MNVEAYREYCLSLGADVEEKLPFVKFKNGEGVLVFYVCGHMFAFFDCNDYHVISLKCQPEQIDELKAQYDCIGNPYNESPKHWIGIDPHTAPDDLLRDLTRNSYEIVKAKYSRKKMNNKITTTELIRTSHTWDGAPLPDFPKGKPELTVFRTVFPVGGITGWHHHTAVNYGIVEQGDLTIVCQDGTERTFHEGEPLIEVVGTIHRGENRGTKPVILDMFYFAEPGKVLTIQHPEI